MENEVLLLKQLMKEGKVDDVVQMLEKGGKIVKKIIRKKKKKGKRKMRDRKPMRIYGPPTHPAPVFGMGPPGPSGIISQGPTAQQIEGSIKRAQEEERRRYDDELDKYKKLQKSNDEIVKVGQQILDYQEQLSNLYEDKQEEQTIEIKNLISSIGKKLLLPQQQPITKFDTQGFQAPTTFESLTDRPSNVIIPPNPIVQEPSNNYVEYVERVIPQDVRGMGFEPEYNPEEEEVERVVEQERQEIPQQVIEEVEQLLGKIDIQPQDLDIQQGKPDAATSEFLFNKPLDGQILGESSAMGQQYKMEDFDVQEAKNEARGKGKQAIASEKLNELFSQDEFPGAIGMNNKISNKLKAVYRDITGYDLPTTKTSAVKALDSLIKDYGKKQVLDKYLAHGKKPILKKNI